MKQQHHTVDKERLSQDIRVEMDNVRDLHDRIYRILECDYIHTEELAALLADANRQATELASLPLNIDAIASLSETMNAPRPSADQPLGRYERLFSALRSHVATSEQLSFYQSLMDNDEASTSLIAAHLLGHTDPIETFARGNIAYQHSIYTDEAFLHFSRVLPTARAVYSDSFSGVCEQVFNGLCEYCILPLENSQDGKLVRFYNLIQKYELKIVLTCSVTTSDNRHSTTFGLCRRGLLWPSLMLPDKPFSFEFLFWQEPEHASLGELLTAASACSLSLVRADCLPRSDEEILIGAGYPFALHFEALPRDRASGETERDFLAFLLYLSVHSPTYLPLGIYQHL
ncbi:MAG: hypothetical protein IJW09_01140 [Clostridia bacterium]|nr:hypothetical protein [Clostridia bacterium]